jgi:hypothetical protein
MLNFMKLSYYNSSIVIDAVIGLRHVTASELEEKPVAREIKKLNLKDLKARAESILEYCMEDIAVVERKKRVKNVIEELNEYLERKCMHLQTFMA